MLKKLFRRLTPSADAIKTHPMLQFLGTWLEDPNLFHFNRYSVSMAFLVGVFLAFLPIPGQTIPAALVALWVRCNLPLAIALVWITNPITIPPIFYATYKLGSWMLDTPPMTFSGQFSWDWIHSELGRIWKPLLAGSFCASVTFSVTSYFCVKQLWRLHVIYQWHNRKQKGLKRPQNHKMLNN